MNSTSTVSEQVEYVCGDCKSTSWHLYICHRDDGQTLLFITCANPECLDAKRIQLGLSSVDMPMWDEFNITGQGYDLLPQAPEELN